MTIVEEHTTRTVITPDQPCPISRIVVCKHYDSGAKTTRVELSIEPNPSEKGARDANATLTAELAIALANALSVGRREQ